MSSDDATPIREVTVDINNLYREESYTDMKVATIRCLIPITADGSDDASRPRVYVGQTQLMSQAGPVPDR